ncbi:MAG: hypothetical protein LLG04_16320 [Parachlamydia sp.]|nr:hypothetical protein [Parachlamydia sp.]
MIPELKSVENNLKLIDQSVEKVKPEKGKLGTNVISIAFHKLGDLINKVLKSKPREPVSDQIYNSLDKQLWVLADKLESADSILKSHGEEIDADVIKSDLKTRETVAKNAQKILTIMHKTAGKAGIRPSEAFRKLESDLGTILKHNENAIKRDQETLKLKSDTPAQMATRLRKIDREAAFAKLKEKGEEAKTDTSGQKAARRRQEGAPAREYRPRPETPLTMSQERAVGPKETQALIRTGSTEIAKTFKDQAHVFLDAATRHVRFDRGTVMEGPVDQMLDKLYGIYKRAAIASKDKTGQADRSIIEAFSKVRAAGKASSEGVRLIEGRKAVSKRTVVSPEDLRGLVAFGLRDLIVEAKKDKSLKSAVEKGWFGGVDRLAKLDENLSAAELLAQGREVMDLIGKNYKPEKSGENPALAKLVFRVASDMQELEGSLKTQGKWEELTPSSEARVKAFRQEAEAPELSATYAQRFASKKRQVEEATTRGKEKGLLGRAKPASQRRGRVGVEGASVKERSEKFQLPERAEIMEKVTALDKRRQATEAIIKSLPEIIANAYTWFEEPRAERTPSSKPLMEKYLNDAQRKVLQDLRGMDLSKLSEKELIVKARSALDLIRVGFDKSSTTMHEKQSDLIENLENQIAVAQGRSKRA